MADMGSVATTFRIVPGAMVSSCLRAFRTGSGQSNPVTSSVDSGLLSDMLLVYSEFREE